jgi:hypothetical protein
MIRTALILLLLASPALAESTRPTPLPQTSAAGCPTGWSASPTSGYCIETRPAG